jgi:hypothetical protein
MTLSSPTPPLAKPWKLLGCVGCGSAIVEAALVLANIPYEREEANYEEPVGTCASGLPAATSLSCPPGSS